MMVKNKKGFLIRDFVAVGIVFGIIIGLFIICVASFSSNYNQPGMINANFASHYDHLTTNVARLSSAFGAVQSTGGLNLIGVFNVAFNSVFTVIAMVWDGVTMYTGMVANIAGDFTFLDQNVILLFLGGVVAIIICYLIFVWLSSVTRGKI
jgi:hypothetical protein